MLLRLRRRARQETVERLYGAIVAQARHPDFYAALAVPDTVAGRFDLIVLHVFLLFRRLAGEGADAQALGQHVFDRFVEDMDDSLREMGTGDLAVPKRLRVMGEAFYGRAAAYDAALAESGNDGLAAALLRNVYGGNTKASARELAHYVRRSVAELAAQEAAEIARGHTRFPAPLEG
ncbi:MAG TPA: ubiquinol-cytochrome C chaperone family protein [Xanthobacteraceae bacterium]|jgi:cytochrome b pre-mRNA-processing protein 3